MGSIEYQLCEEGKDVLDMSSSVLPRIGEAITLEGSNGERTVVYRVTNVNHYFFQKEDDGRRESGVPMVEVVEKED